MTAQEVGPIVRDAIMVFGSVTTVTFLLVATRRHWARSKAPLVTGAGATLWFVAATFVFTIIMGLVLCELGAGTLSPTGTTFAFEIGAAYTAVVVGFHGAVHLDAVTKELLPAVEEKMDANIVDDGALPAIAATAVQPPGLKKLTQKQGAPLCWTCGESKESEAHIKGCPAAKGGAP